MRDEKRQAVMPRDVVARILAAAGDRLVLVGGQALAIWLDRYDLVMQGGFAYVSRDADFLAESAAAAADVRRLARALGGRAELPSRRSALTALVGQPMKDISSEEILNVDVLHRVWGADARAVRARSVEFRDDRAAYRVMHPLDLLKSRVDDLHGLPEKQNELGCAQLRAAIAVTQAFLREAAADHSHDGRRPVTLRYAAFIEQLARGDAGKKVAKHWGIHVADAVEPAAVPSTDFRSKKLPRLAALMSPARRRALGL